jgi:micrococcal nuclease
MLNTINNTKQCDALKNELFTCCVKNTPRFTLAGNEYLGKCISVYDGDTVTVAFKPFHKDGNIDPGGIYKYSIRLTGIDTPEIRTKNENEKKEAIAIRDILRGKILNKFVIIKCGGFDKYGRLLGDIYNEDQSIHYNSWLIEQGYAYKYDGGTKRTYS